MKEICINLDEYNRDSINTIQGNNNAEVYKIYVLFNKRRIDLTGKTVKMAYLRTGTVEGDVINLNVTNATKGEITLQITNAISKRDGVYSCQLAICGADEFLEHTATFGLTVQANIFTKIAGEITDTKDLTYIERILEEATNISEELKSNIPVARQLNIDLENQNRILNENMDRANGANNTLIATTEQSKVAVTDAIEKKSQLESSIVEAKKFIDGLDGSQSIPDIRMELTELQNGLKSNQALAYSGSSISAENTLEGRTTDMVIKGRTLQNLWDIKTIDGFYMTNLINGYFIENNKEFPCKPNTKYTVIYNEKTPTDCYASVLYKDIHSVHISEGVNCYNGKMATFTTPSNCYYLYTRGFRSDAPHTVNGNGFNFIILEGDHTNKDIVYFEGIKSFGELEGNKISILSNSENLVDTNNSELWQLNKGLWSHGNGENPNLNGGMITDYIDISYIKNVTLFLKGRTSTYFFCCYDENKKALMNINKQHLKPSNAKFIRFFVLVNENNTPLTRFENPYLMLSYDTFKDYKPYKQDEKDILIKKPLRSKDNVQDIMYEDNGQVKIDRYIGVRKYQEGDERNKDVLTDKINTVYILDKPIIEVVENCVDIDLDTFGEKTYFNILNSIKGSLDFKVPSNIASIVQNTAREVNNIWDVINNLLVPSIVKANGNLAMLKLNNNLN